MAEDTTKIQTEAVDINDQTLEVEELNVDVEADQFAALPTVGEGIYRAKLIQKKPSTDVDSLWIKVHGTKKNPNVTYLKTGIEARIVEPGNRFDDWPVFDNFVSTMVQQMTGTNKIVGIIKALGEHPVSLNDVALAQQLTALLAAEPTVRISVTWEGYCESCEKTVLRGEKRFPQNGHGGHLNTAECSKDGTQIVAQSRIDKYLADV